MSNESTKIFLGNIIYCRKNSCSLQRYQPVEVHDGFVIVSGAKIVAVGKQADLEKVKASKQISQNVELIRLSDTQLLIPGLIDTHIHAPQYPNCGLGYDKPLLEWLDTYTYKLERRYKDLDYAKKVFDAVVKRTLSHGTTTACYYASLFRVSSMLLVESVIENGQRAFVGKINMTTLAPEDYLETPEDTLRETKQFIVDVRSKKNNLVEPIITPRFALSLDMASMKSLGNMAEEYDVNIQTHISENVDEVDMVKAKYNMEYASVYDKAKLLTKKTVLAHGIYLTDEEVSLISENGSSISHCPESNTCLKSGLCDVKKLLHHGVTVGLGTDVSGGPSPSIVSAMRAALAVSVHISFSKNHSKTNQYIPLSYLDVFYLATLGGAEALSIDEKVGSFEEGKDFDALIVDMSVDDGTTDLLLECSPLELLQKFIYTGDDRNILKVFVAGKSVK